MLEHKQITLINLSCLISIIVLYNEDYTLVTLDLIILEKYIIIKIIVKLYKNLLKYYY